jgi:hypothetical protein
VKDMTEEKDQTFFYKGRRFLQGKPCIAKDGGFCQTEYFKRSALQQDRPVKLPQYADLYEPAAAEERAQKISFCH